MNRLTICTVRVGIVDYAIWTLPAIRLFCERHDYDFKVYDCPPCDNRHATWQKLEAILDFRGSGPLLIVDLDMMPTPNLGSIAYLLDSQNLSLTRSVISSRCASRFSKLRIPQEFWFNNSMMGIPPEPHASKWRMFFESVYNSPDAERLPYAEMAATCRELARRHLQPNILPGFCDRVIDRKEDATQITEECFLHFAGADHRKKDRIKSASSHFYPEFHIPAF